MLGLDLFLGQLSEAFSECGEGELGLSECLLPLSHLVWHEASFLPLEHQCPQALGAFTSLVRVQCLGTDCIICSWPWPVLSQCAGYSPLLYSMRNRARLCLLLWY